MSTIAPVPAYATLIPAEMSEQEFLEWSSHSAEVRAEWVDGKVIIMSAVELAHARIVHFLTLLLGMYCREQELGEVLGEPYQVRFTRLRRRRMPDLMFVAAARVKHLARMQFDGAPDLIIEVVSPDSQTRDRREKFLEYQDMGVREYWIIDPLVKGAECYTLKRAKTYTPIPEVDGQVHSKVIPGLYIRPEWLWQLRPPKVLALLKEMNAI